MIRTGKEMCIIITHYFSHIPKPIQKNHLWLYNSLCSLQRRDLLERPIWRMKMKRGLWLGSLLQAGTRRTGWRSKSRSASNSVYLDWGSVAILHLISMVHTILLQPWGKGSSAFCLEVVIAICLSFFYRHHIVHKSSICTVEKKSWMIPFRDPMQEKMGVMCRARVIRKQVKKEQQ